MPNGTFDDIKFLHPEVPAFDYVKDVYTDLVQTHFEFWAPTDFDILFYYQPD